MVEGETKYFYLLILMLGTYSFHVLCCYGYKGVDWLTSAVLDRFM